jgi:MoxR-like ATPase
MVAAIFRRVADSERKFERSTSWPGPDLTNGADPRAGQFLIQGGKALAAMDARFSVAIEDVQKIAIPVLRHRISTNFQAQAEGMSNEDIIQRLIRETPPPVIPKYEK